LPQSLKYSILKASKGNIGGWFRLSDWIAFLGGRKTMEFIQLEQQGNVMVVTINRAEVLNALNDKILRELDILMSEMEDREDVHVLVLTGAGRSFVAGADIGEMVNFTAVDGKRFSEHGNSVFMKLENCTKPIIAAVNGFALGGGCELAMSCDIRLASEKAKFGMPEVGLGITAGFGGTQRLSRLVGTSRAMELILTAKTIDAQEALAIDLVSHVYPPEELMDRTMELAQDIAAKAQVAVRQSKQSIRRGMQIDMNTAVAFEAEAFGLCFSTQDQKDPMNAFLNKRKMNSYKDK